ncbi:hypothetical protein QYF61_010229 [Mycteria americana]|uniref:Uncharacterized protein n=1 Tax=Mycteria americana TaxID=33587 RepID=A0AAN7NSS2_MYCAM|nr:hypothetical protein QYF61_010229 [Mycteria americana]
MHSGRIRGNEHKKFQPDIRKKNFTMKVLGCTLQYTKFKQSDNGVCSAYLSFENCLEEQGGDGKECFWRLV